MRLLWQDFEAGADLRNHHAKQRAVPTIQFHSSYLLAAVELKKRKVPQSGVPGYLRLTSLKDTSQPDPSPKARLTPGGQILFYGE